MTTLPQAPDHSVIEKNDLSAAALPARNRLPDTRESVTHKFNICGHEGYLIVGLFEDGRPGELFIKIAKQGSTMAGLADTIGILTSLALQYGVPIEALARKFENRASSCQDQRRTLRFDTHLPLVRAPIFVELST